MSVARRVLVRRWAAVRRRLRDDGTATGCAETGRTATGRTATGSTAGDRGSAVVEFLGIALVLLIPLVYLVLVLGRVQGATFAAEGAAREAGRIIAQAEDLDEAVADARTAVELAFADHGITVDAGDALRLTCEREPCLTPGAQVHIEVSTALALPLVPEFARGVLPMEVAVGAEHLAAVAEFGPVP